MNRALSDWLLMGVSILIFILSVTLLFKYYTTLEVYLDSSEYERKEVSETIYAAEDTTTGLEILGELMDRERTYMIYLNGSLLDASDMRMLYISCASKEYRKTLEYDTDGDLLVVRYKG